MSCAAINSCRCFNAHYDERCFPPIHVYDTATSRPVAVVLRPGKTPSGVEVRAHLRRLVRRIRSRWPATRIRFRGDGHYARPEAMTWCEESVDYVFGLPGAKPLSEKTDAAADAVRARARRSRRRARLRRNPSQGRLLGQGKARHRPHRGHAARPRHSASSSPASVTARPNGCMRASIARAARRKI